MILQIEISIAQNRFWTLWKETGLNDNELEFYLKIYFSFFDARLKILSKAADESKVKRGQKLFKSEIEAMEETQLPENDDAQIYFGLTHTPRCV